MLIPDAPEARRIVKANPSPAPFTVLCGHIFGDENNPRGPADELVLFGIGLRRDKREDGSAVGSGHCYPTIARLKPGIKSHLESELIYVES